MWSIYWASLVPQMVKNLPVIQETQAQSLGWEDPLEKGMATPILLPREFHGLRNLAGYSLWGHKESDTTEQLTHYTNLIHKMETEVFHANKAREECICGNRGTGIFLVEEILCTKVQIFETEAQSSLLGRGTVTQTSIIIEQRVDGRFHAMGQMGKDKILR